MILKFEIFRFNIFCTFVFWFRRRKLSATLLWGNSMLVSQVLESRLFFLPLLPLVWQEEFSVTYNDDGPRFSVDISNFRYSFWECNETKYLFLFWKIKSRYIWIFQSLSDISKVFLLSVMGWLKHCSVNWNGNHCFFSS